MWLQGSNDRYERSDINIHSVCSEKHASWHYKNSKYIKIFLLEYTEFSSLVSSHSLVFSLCGCVSQVKGYFINYLSIPITDIEMYSEEFYN